VIAIIDSDIGNTRAVENLFWSLGLEARSTRSCEVLEAASHLVLCGVAKFDAAMRSLHRIPEVTSLVRERVLVEGIPFLGICSGMQVLFSSSEEGTEPGLGWLKGHVSALNPHPNLPVPHMGWNTVRVLGPSKLVEEDNQEYYFCHSYAVQLSAYDGATAAVDYGDSLVAIVEEANIFGVQFHPEKSLSAGKKLLESFARA